MGAQGDDSASAASGTGSRKRLTRRDFLRAGAMAGVAGAVGSRLGGGLNSSQGRLIEKLVNAASSSFDSSVVKHVVVLMQENRSFDHYFGTLNGVRGFADSDAGNYATGVRNTAPFLQAGPAAALPGWSGPGGGGTALLAPWQLVTNFPTENGQSTNDISHEWGTQHLAWNGGAMDQWFAAHAGALSSNPDAPGDKNGFPIPIGAPANDGYMTMGYLAQPDLAFYHALADAFTICDGYFCSVMGPTDPNRLMLMSNSIGIEFGTPMLETLVQTRPQAFGSIGWKTMPEALNGAGGPKNAVTGASGLSWKVYGDPTAQLLFNVLPYFKQYQSDPQLAVNAFGWQYPANFLADVAAGTLPQVSWLLPPANACEHPAAPPSQGEEFVYQVLTALTANPAVWAQTVLFVVYDENGGWFDHVPPPTPSFTADISGNTKNSGEWLGGGAGGTTTVAGPSAGTYEEGPVGLGFRTPCLVISPFSQGGLVCSPYFSPSGGGPVRLDPAGTFDHTSINRFIATVFNAQGYELELPNLSPWRTAVTGDFTRAFTGATTKTPPSFNAPVSSTDVQAAAAAVINGLAGTVSDAPLPYPPPTKNVAPPAPDGAGLTLTYTPPA